MRGVAQRAILVALGAMLTLSSLAWGESEPDVVWVSHGGQQQLFGFTPNGQAILIGRQDEFTQVYTLKLCRVPDGVVIQEILPEDQVMSADISPDGRMVVIGCYGSGVKLWDIPSRQFLPAPAVTGTGNRVSFFPDGQHIIRGESPYLGPEIWRISDRKLLFTVDDLWSDLHCSSDGLIVATSGLNETKIWKLGGDTPLFSIPSTLADLSPDDAVVATVDTVMSSETGAGERDIKIKLWRMADGEYLRALEGHTKGVLGASFSSDGRHLASTSYDGTVKIWNVSDGRLLQTFDCGSVYLGPALFSPIGDYLAVQGGSGFVWLWRLDDGTLAYELVSHRHSVTNPVALSSDGRKMAVGGFSPDIMVFSADDGHVLNRLRQHSDDWFDFDVSSLAFSPDGEFVAFGKKGQASLWDLSSGEVTASYDLDDNSTQSYSVAVPLHADLLAVAGESLNLRRLTDGTLVREFTGVGDSLALDISDDGSLIAYDGPFPDHKIQIARTSTGEILQSLAWHEDGMPYSLTSLAFSLDGSKLVSSGENTDTVKVWTVSDGSLISKLTRPEVLPIKSGPNTAAFSPDAEVVVSGVDDNALTFWRASDGQVLKSCILPDGENAVSLAWSADGLFVACSLDKGEAMLLLNPLQTQKRLLKVTALGSGTVEPTGGVYTRGSTVALVAKPAVDHRVKQWTGTDDDGSSANSNWVTVNESRNVLVEFEPIFTPVRWALKIDTLHPGSVDPPGGIFDSMTEVVLTAKPDAFWKFDHWEGDLSGTRNPAAVTVDRDLEITAVFSPGSSNSGGGEENPSIPGCGAGAYGGCASSGLVIILLSRLGLFSLRPNARHRESIKFCGNGRRNASSTNACAHATYGKSPSGPFL